MPKNTMLNDTIIASIVMPIYNEELYISNCIESLLKQDFNREAMEWIFVDGRSTDHTMSILNKYQVAYPKLIKVFENEHTTVPYAMNIGIKQAKGKYIIRLDAHAEYANNYISKCVELLNKNIADNVGGALETKGRGFTGKTIAKMLSSKFGVGNSGFRTFSKDMYVDTVPFGAFKKEVFEKWGLYDERLTRNQDNELNYRIRKNGGKVFLSNEIHLSYYCRDSLKEITRMAKNNGQWNIITMKLCPGSMGLRHFIPMLFVLSLVFEFIFMFYFDFAKYIFFSELLLYFLFDIIFSFKLSETILEFLYLLLLFPAFHISYGIGSIIGLIRQFKFRR